MSAKQSTKNTLNREIEIKTFLPRIYYALNFLAFLLLFPKTFSYIYTPLVVYRRETIYLSVTLGHSEENLVILILFTMLFLALYFFITGKNLWTEKTLMFLIPVLGLVGVWKNILLPLFIGASISAITLYVFRKKDLFPVCMGLGTVGLISIIETIFYKDHIVESFFVKILLYFWLFFKPLLLIIMPIALVFSTIKILVFLEKKASREKKVESQSNLILLFVGVAIAIIFYAIPYTAYFNPSGKLATTDIIFYTRYLGEMRASGNPIEKAFSIGNGDRPFYLLLLYVLMRIFGLNEASISTISGWVWSGLLVVSVWYMVREQFGSKIAYLTALLTGFSQQALAFIFGGFQANHFTLSLLYIAIGLLSLPTTKRVAFGSLLLFIAPFFHVWSWLHIGVILIVWRALLFLRNKDKTALMAFLLPLTAFTISLFIEWFVLGSIGKVVNVVAPATKNAVVFGVQDKITGLWDALNIYLWGSLGIPTFLLIIPLAQYLILKNELDIIEVMLIVSLVLAFVFSPNITLVTRLLLNIPLQVYMGVILSKTNTTNKNLLGLALLAFSFYYAVNAVPS